MIERYSRKPMSKIWAPEGRFEALLKVEKQVALVQSQMGIIPKKAGLEISKKGKFDLKRIKKIEEKTKHDVIAFVTNVAETVGTYGPYVHYALTSSDVLDTATALQTKKAGLLLKKTLKELEQVLRKKVRQDQNLLCVGRTHGMHAEMTSYGLKWAHYLSELKRSKKRFENALEGMLFGKLSGSVGTYSLQSIEVEEKVCDKLGLKREPISTQVIPRDRHAELFWSLSMLGHLIERISLEIRHLQRTEVGEVSEGFSVGQKGSSAMPHKKNPIGSENLTGCARLLRSYASAASENINLWHERDITHSSVERLIFPDAFILCDYMVSRMSSLLSSLKVHKKNIQKNIQRSQGKLFTSELLLFLIKKGLKREKAYELLQKLSHSLKENENLKDKILKDKTLKKHFTKKQLDAIFGSLKLKKNIKRIVERVLKP